MSAKRPPAIERKMYIEIDREVYRQTGAIELIGTPIDAPTITEQVPRGQFEVVYTAELFNLLKDMGNTKIKILAWMLDHKDGNNSLNVTMREISDTLHVSTKTVNATIKLMREAGLLKRKGTVYMISPGLMIKGSQLREAWLMRRFQEMPEGTIPQKPEPETVKELEIDPQLSFINAEMDIGQKAVPANEIEVRP